MTQTNRKPTRKARKMFATPAGISMTASPLPVWLIEAIRREQPDTYRVLPVDGLPIGR